MNERIRELAKEALDYAEKNQSAEVQQHWFKLYNEKFAELIVRECIAKVEMRKKFAIEDQHIVDHAFNLLVYDLESHFGVER